MLATIAGLTTPVGQYVARGGVVLVDESDVSERQTVKKLAQFSASAVFGIALLGVAQSADAGAIPYGAIGTPILSNFFVANATGDITAYFAGSSAGDTDFVGLYDESTSTWLSDPQTDGFTNHSPPDGTTYDLGAVTAGDVLAFAIYNSATSLYLYSDPSLNLDGYSHTYAADVGASAAYPGSPAGTFIGFEDLMGANPYVQDTPGNPFADGSDFDYNDLTFVVSGVTDCTNDPNAGVCGGGINGGPVPEPLTLSIFGAGLLGAAGMRRRRKASKLA
jgi:Domain of unknown function (DUF4114)/PEP-CTERM motif